MSDDGLLDESVLRSALRLELHERPRVALSTLLALAEAEPAGHRAARALALGTFALGAAGVCLAALAVVIEVVAVAMSPAAVAAVGPAAALLIDASRGIGRLATEPATPIAIIVALIVALTYGRAAERNGTHASAS